MAEGVAFHGNSIEVVCKFDTKGSCTVKTLCCFEINRSGYNCKLLFLSPACRDQDYELCANKK